MAEIPKWKQQIAKQVDSILLDYPHSIAIFRKKTREFCAEYRRYLDARGKFDPTEITDEEFDSLMSGSDTWPDNDETALKNIPPDPIPGGEYSKLPATKKEALNGQYTALAVLHDNILRKELQENQVILTDKSVACLMVQKLVINNAAYDEQFYEDALDAVQADLKTAETKQDATPAKIIIKNFKGVLGDVQAETVQTGDYASIHKHPVTAGKKKGIIWKILKVIVKIIGAIVIGIIVAVVIDILGDFGWLQSIKEAIYSILWHK